LTEEVLRGFLSDISIIWDVRCRNLHNPAMALNYRMQMMLELLSLLMSRYTVGVQEAAKAFHKKSNRNRQRKDVHYEVQTVPFPP
jgi:hypothetical protein